MRLPRIASAALVLLMPVAAHADDEDSPPLSIYGAARLDILANSAGMDDVHRSLFVEQDPSGAQTAGEMTMTPRLSQVGLGIDQWELDDRGHYIGEGKLEIDFGGGAGTNVIRLRHAYATVTVRNKLEILAGQTWDLISPLAPMVQEDTLLLFAGNTGDRRPQLRLSALPVDNIRVAVAAAATGNLDQRDLDGDGKQDGVTAGAPMVQGLIELRQPMRRGGRPILVGLWGHAAREEQADGTNQPSRSLGMHLQVPAPFMTWSAEIYGGTNASDIGGAVGRNVDAMTGRRTHSVGGWFEVALAPTKKHVLAFGGSGDIAAIDDVMPGDRSGNGTVYTALRYKPSASLQLGAEYLYWKTIYLGAGAAIANRFDFHLSVLF